VVGLQPLATLIDGVHEMASRQPAVMCGPICWATLVANT
jgi:hypothetical protein